MPNHYSEVEKQVEAWLRGEHEYQFAKNKKTLNADPPSSVEHILGTEIGNKWHRFQFFIGQIVSPPDDDDKVLRLHAGQQLLKACAAARGALVWKYVLQANEAARGDDQITRGSDQTWRDLSNYYDALHDGTEALPSSGRLKASLEIALNPATLEPVNGNYDVKPIFTRLAGLAVVHFASQQEQSGEVIMPAPGVRSGEIEAWLPPTP
jgi:hypothetical protein